MKQLPNIAPLSTERLAKMTSEEFAEFAHLINNIIEEAKIENLYFVLFRERFCNYLETIFVSEDFRFTIDIDENSHIYGQITSSYDKQRRERRADKQPIADRRYMFGSNSSLETYLCKAFVAYKEEVKYYNKHNNKQINNIEVMKRNSTKQVCLANESVATSIVEGWLQVEALPEGMSVNISDWMQNVTNGRLASTTDNSVVTISVRKGIATSFSISELADENFREDVKILLSSFLDSADRINSREIKSVPGNEEIKCEDNETSSAKTVEVSMTEDEISKFNEYFCSEKGQKVLTDTLDSDDYTMQKLVTKLTWALKRMSKDLGITKLKHKADYLNIMTADSKKLYDDFLSLATNK